jgi:hypothetical protein
VLCSRNASPATLKIKAVILRKMLADARGVPNSWTAHITVKMLRRTTRTESYGPTGIAEGQPNWRGLPDSRIIRWAGSV